MIEETIIKSHLVVTNMYNDYNIKWCGKIVDSKPKFENNKPIFIIVGGNGRMEINTWDIKRVEKCAKLLTRPRGRQAITSDTSRIFIKEEDDNEKLLGILTHHKIKEFDKIYDKIPTNKEY